MQLKAYTSTYLLVLLNQKGIIAWTIMQNLYDLWKFCLKVVLTWFIYININLNEVKFPNVISNIWTPMLFYVTRLFFFLIFKARVIILDFKCVLVMSSFGSSCLITLLYGKLFIFLLILVWISCLMLSDRGIKWWFAAELPWFMKRFRPQYQFYVIFKT